jgi:hypothetical protein
MDGFMYVSVTEGIIHPSLEDNLKELGSENLTKLSNHGRE